MSLRYALLALLTAAPLTGYDAAKRFRGTVGHVWHAPDSQIYPELNRMEKAGLVESELVPWGQNNTKKRYNITEAGIDSFVEWMHTPLEYGPVRKVHHLKAAYYEWTSDENVRAHLRRHIEFHAHQVSQWNLIRAGILERSNPTINSRIEKCPSGEEHERIVAFKAFTYEGMIALAEAEIEWAEHGLDLVDQLAAKRAESS